MSIESVRYRSTRDIGAAPAWVNSSYAIVHGIAEDGGLYVPERIPKMDRSLDELLKMNYRELAYEVMKLYLTDFPEEVLKECIARAYDEKFDTPLMAPLSCKTEIPVLELFHGATLAFKDMALSILPYLLTQAAQMQNIQEEIVILTATSGDTGKAALEGFADVPNVRIIVFFPKDGVSTIQRLQMVTQRGDNTYVVAMKGNFDDAQRSVKTIFTDTQINAKLKKAGFVFSSANSINIGRLIPQVVYYFWGYLQMVRAEKVRLGDPVHYSVPTGNFGNILAAYYAREMGLPISQLLCASNKNNVLTDFFRTGSYNANRPFYVTSSPSMDILVSSNLERYLYSVCEKEKPTEAGVLVKDMMSDLKQNGSFIFNEDREELVKNLRFGWVGEEETEETIAETWKKTGYVMDPHTAVAYRVALDYQKTTKDPTPIVVDSTASPYKFAGCVLQALQKDISGEDPEKNEKAADHQFRLLQEVSRLSDTPIPESLRYVLTASPLHHRVCEKDAAWNEVRDILGIVD